jgi:hypothetical protein
METAHAQTLPCSLIALETMKGRAHFRTGAKSALPSLEPAAPSFSMAIHSTEIAQIRTVCVLFHQLKDNFNGDGAVVSYLNTTKETDRCAVRE